MLWSNVIKQRNMIVSLNIHRYRQWSVCPTNTFFVSRLSMFWNNACYERASICLFCLQRLPTYMQHCWKHVFLHHLHSQRWVLDKIYVFKADVFHSPGYFVLSQFVIKLVNKSKLCILITKNYTVVVKKIIYWLMSQYYRNYVKVTSITVYSKRVQLQCRYVDNYSIALCVDVLQ